MMPCRRVCDHFLTTLLAVWFAVGLAASPPPACAQMAVTGSDPAAHAAQSWYDTHVPARFHAHSPLPVRLLDARAMAAYVHNGEPNSEHNGAGDSSNDGDADGVVDGLYESDPEAVTVLLPQSGTVDMFTLGHEYGHFVWFRLLGKDDRRRYEDVYRQQRAAHHLVTAYAATDAEEGFAEAFSFYVNEPPLLAWRDPVSYRFLNRCLMPAPAHE